MFSVRMGESHAHLKQVSLWWPLLIIASCWGGDQGFGMEVEKDMVTTPLVQAGGVITKDGSHSFDNDLWVSY